ncbi:LOW QUALITY PROTEIN: fas-binding factor 1 homolog [Cuculus canorus]|uniref:LOW QUALITY PROTEIN: fas-binding factor 1 homolog n=1 Tax=Cuculus canorus TaxID=55661 RepID=UPI0023AB34A0|nr:LOW QUALITY PROTEIN: fas-binding factor 1 homolog [Cuculus canorus]
MAAKPKRDFGGSFDAILDDLLGSDDEAPAKPARASQLGGRAQSTSVQASKESFLKDDFISKLPAEDTGAAEGSSASNGDKQALLQTLKDMEEMEADLLGISKPNSGPRKTSVKVAGKHDSLGGAGKPLAHEKETPQTPLHTATPVWRRRTRQELKFEDDGNNLVNALGLDSGLKGDGQQGKKVEDREELQPARHKLDELLGRGSMAKVLEQPVMGDRKEFELDKKYQKQPEKEEGCKEEDFVFGAYQPSVASTVKHRPARRPSVSRFSAENSSEPKPEPCSKPPPASRSPVRCSRTGGDWLGLKDKDFLDSEPPSPVKASPAASYPSPTSLLPAAEQAANKPSPVEEESWLMAALSRKKAQAQAKAQERSAEPSEAPGKELDPHSPIRQMATSTGAPQQAAASQEKVATADGSGQPIPWLSTPKAAPAHPSEAANKVPSRDASALVPTALIIGEQETQSLAPLAQVATPWTHLQAVPQQQAVSSALGSLQERRLGFPHPKLYEDASSCQAALLGTQARMAELESRVRTLELEQVQHRLLLESLQQRHREDLELLESAHRSRVKVVEETYGQREERLRQEKEQLVGQLLSQSRDAEQARAELVTQHQQRLATLEQQSALELERLRELQRVSVQEMRKDHEEQLQWLKQLKDQEIDAVTSAASHARSLNGVIEQMEKFSSHLHNLSHKVEAMHHSTSQELALGAWHRDQQLKVLQDRLSQQQRDMEEELSQLQEVIARMETRLSEQTRLLEQERWRATAEQSKVESLQHSLEEQRRIMTQQLSMERAELERAKSALLEEQKSVMQKCLEERRKLAAEWTEFHTQLSKEWMECEMERTLQMHSQREGTILSLAKEQADLKIWSRELKAKEEQLARDRELLDEAWWELRLEKEKVNRSALRIQQQEEKIKSMTNLSSQKYDEGERASREACRMESEQQSGLQVMQQHLKQKEQHLHEDRLSMSYQRQQLQKLREELPSNPAMLLTAEQDLSARMKGLSTLCFLPPLGTLPWQSLGSSRETLAVAGSTELYTELLLLKYRAQQDHRFLEDEQFFLESLTNASHRAAPRSG